MRIFFTRDPEASPDWLEGGYKPASQPTNHFDLTSHLHLPNLPPPPPPPHLTPEAPTEPPSHLIRREGGFRPAHVRAGQAFEAQISRGARVNFHSLKARIFFAGKHAIPYVPRLTGCPGSNILTLKSATFQEWMVEWVLPSRS